MIKNTKIGVVGAGSWGTVLSNLLCRNGLTVNLWAYEKEVKEHIQNFRENKYFLPGIPLSPDIIPSNELEEVVAGRDFLVVVVPSHVLRMVARKMARFINQKTVIISASKGIENKTHLTMSAVLQEVLSHVGIENFVVLSGFIIFIIIIKRHRNAFQ